MKIKITYDLNLERDVRQQCVASADIPYNFLGAYRTLRVHGSTFPAARADLMKQVKLYLSKPADEDVEIDV